MPAGCFSPVLWHWLLLLGVQWAEPQVSGREAATSHLPTATSLTWPSVSQARQPHSSTNSKAKGHVAGEQDTLRLGGQEGGPVREYVCARLRTGDTVHR